jgi:hypothetical protein
LISYSCLRNSEAPFYPVVLIYDFKGYLSPFEKEYSLKKSKIQGRRKSSGKKWGRSAGRENHWNKNSEEDPFV